MRAFVTGATGFIGSHLAHLLVESGYEVHVVVRSSSDLWRIEDIIDSIQVFKGDLASADLASALKEIRPDVAFLLAWYVETGKYLSSPQNLSLISDTIQLVSGLTEAGCARIVSAGTCLEYDTDFGFLTEETPTLPRSLYAASKLALQLVLHQYARVRKASIAWARIFLQYGPFEDQRRLIPSVILALQEGNEARVTPGEQIRDYLHVKDVARAILAVAESKLEGPVNVGSGQPISVRDVVLRIGDLLDKRQLIKLGAIPYSAGDPMFICADTSKLREATGWQPCYNLDEGLRNTIDWWRQHHQRIGEGP